MVLKFSGVRRKADYSPNHVTNDLLIANLTAEQLVRQGAEVEMHEEGQFTPAVIRTDLVFSMAQGPDGIRQLMSVQQRGALIINSPQSVQNCYRVNMVTLLPKGTIPFPKSIIVQTSDHIDRVPDNFAGKQFWIKRGDVHAVEQEDVVLVHSEPEALAIMERFRRRGITEAVVQDHIDGDTVKFYAVRETDFFHWYYLNGTYHTSFELQHLMALADSSAEILGLYVYGGDAIIRTDGSITIIDINDWPSFAPVRQEASQQIAQLLIQKAEKYVHNLQH